MRLIYYYYALLLRRGGAGWHRIYFGNASIASLRSFAARNPFPQVFYRLATFPFSHMRTYLFKRPMDCPSM